MCEIKDEEQLNDSIPQDTIVKVLLKKIKLQETEIQELRHKINVHKETKRKQEEKIKKLQQENLKVAALLGESSPEERAVIKANPLYKEILLLKREMLSVIKQKDEIINQLIIKLNEKK